MLAAIASAPKNIKAVRALRHPNFRWLWLSTSAQAVGRGMQFLTLGWLVLELTDSSIQLGLVIFLYGIPNLSFVLFGGIIADRIDRRLLLVTSQAAVTLTVLVLATLTILDSITLWHIYAGSFLLGTLQALNTAYRAGPISVISIIPPAMAGPKMRPEFIMAEFSTTAFIKSSRSTRSETIAMINSRQAVPIR